MSENRSYTRITTAVLASDVDFFRYLWAAEIKTGKLGGTFVGNRAVAPEKFRKYGIICPKGGMILPQVEPDVLRGMLRGADTYVADREYELDREGEFTVEPSVLSYPLDK